MTNTWIYICDTPEDESDPIKGYLYVTKADPNSVIKSDDGKWVTKNGNTWWYEVDRDTLRIKHDRENIDPNSDLCMRDVTEALLLDLSTIPIPTYEDSSPIIVIQSIKQNINYYIEE